MFRFNGVSAKEMGVVIDEMDFFSKAQRSYESTAIDGLDGENIEIGDYKNVTGSFEITLLKNNLADVMAWLNGKGTLSYDDRETTIYILDQVDYERLGGLKSATVNYIRAPFWNKADDIYLKVNGSTVFNDGNMTSSPLIKIEKGSNYTETITINDVEFSVTFYGIKDAIIDCAKKIEVDGEGVSISNLLEIGYEYPTLNPGINRIEVSGDASVWIKNKECWL